MNRQRTSFRSLLQSALLGAMLLGSQGLFAAEAARNVVPGQAPHSTPFESIFSRFLLTGVDIRGESPVPERLFLDQNFPNPFNPTTMIRYGIPVETNVKLTIYTLLGTPIRVLVDERQEGGIYEYDFSAIDLPSGAYFYRLQTSLGTLTRRLTVSK
ncbi:MAG: T9SS C-terminal target domain-containing protein [Chlorobi bacterium CHB2]|nr:T9SS C-terminal target domain-containing protein [Chlorobi bacterium CHB2]